MDNEVYNGVTMVSIDIIVYHAIYEVRYSLLKRLDKKNISYVKEFLDGNEIEESIFLGKIANPYNQGKNY